MRWIKPNVKGRKPCPRYFHAITLIGDAVIVVGGKDDHLRFNDVHVFNKDPKASHWTQPHIRGTPPKQRSAHSINVIGSKIYIFGGHRDGEKFNDVLVLDTSCMAWVHPRTKGRPPGRRNAHTATSCDTRIFVFGGFDGESCNDLYYLDTESLVWHQPLVQGAKPTRRCCHTTTLIGSKMWVFGGKNNDSEGVIDRFNDVHCFDSVAMAWVELGPVAGTPPSKRNAHSTVAVDTNLLVFGGFDGESCNDVFWFETERLMWREVSCSSTTPCARYCHASVSYPIEGGGHAVLVFGGCDADRNYADVQILEIRPEDIPGHVAQAQPSVPELERQLLEVGRERDRLLQQVDQQTELIRRLQEEKAELAAELAAAQAAQPPPRALSETSEQGLQDRGGKQVKRPRGRGSLKSEATEHFPPAPPDAHNGKRGGADSESDALTPQPPAQRRRESQAARGGQAGGDLGERASSTVSVGGDDEEGGGGGSGRRRRRRRKDKKRRQSEPDAAGGAEEEEAEVSAGQSSGALPPATSPTAAGQVSPHGSSGQASALTDVVQQLPPPRGRLPALETDRRTELFPPLRSDRITAIGSGTGL
eukprot:TRINITY_DN5875_c0_g1_i1.p1 TRINITY_DN5875_c0_g1~~TRINITY_DN5875_c0_g1_i1.p1  ORF type:complete len:589 (+),score=155.39 TRINITY_DN5875_c0_g1_i1:152-1918(+)